MTGARLAASALLLGVLGGCSQGSSPDDAGSPVGATVAGGRIATIVRRCDACHQSTDPAAGLLSGQTTPTPGSTQSYGSNLTPDPDTGLDDWDAGSIAEAILIGVGQGGRALCPAMPRWADAGMQQDEALAIAAYLRSLVAVWHPVPASTCSAAGPAGDAGR